MRRTTSTATSADASREGAPAMQTIRRVLPYLWPADAFWVRRRVVIALLLFRGGAQKYDLQYFLGLKQLQTGEEHLLLSENEEFAAKCLFELVPVFFRSQLVGILDNQWPEVLNAIDLNQLQAQLCLLALEKVLARSLVLFYCLLAAEKLFHLLDLLL